MTVRIPPRSPEGDGPAEDDRDRGSHGTSIRGPSASSARRWVALARGAIEQRWAFARLPGGHAAIVRRACARDGSRARLRRVSHPSLGLPPVDRSGGLPPIARRLDTRRDALAARALEIAIDRDPTLRERYDEIGMRRLLRDTAALLDRVVEAVAQDDPGAGPRLRGGRRPGLPAPEGPDGRPDQPREGIRTAIGAVLPRRHAGRSTPPSTR